MSQMNPKEVFDNTAYSVQLPYIAGHSQLPSRSIYLLQNLSLDSYQISKYKDDIFVVSQLSCLLGHPVQLAWLNLKKK